MSDPLQVPLLGGKVGDDVMEAERPSPVHRDARALRILAKTIYRELRQGGLVEQDLMVIASEMLSLVACDMKDRRRASTSTKSVLGTGASVGASKPSSG